MSAPSRERKGAEILVFDIGGRRFGLPLPEVREIVRLAGGSVCRVPGAPEFFYALAGARGRTIPVVDGALLLGLSADDGAGELLVMDTPYGEVGLMARVADMRIVRRELLAPRQDAPFFDACSACFEEDGQSVPVLDTQKLLSPQGLSLGEAEGGLRDGKG